MHIPAPRLKLPGHSESYNPPPEYLPNEKEKEEWEQQDKEDRAENFLPQRFVGVCGGGGGGGGMCMHVSG